MPRWMFLADLDQCAGCVPSTAAVTAAAAVVMVEHTSAAAFRRGSLGL